MYAKRTGIMIKKTRMTEIPKTVFEHEIPVLNFKYGANKIEKIKLPRLVYLNPKDPMYVQRGFKRHPIIEIDHDEEWNRMNATYGKHEESGQVCVEMAYGFIQERRLETLNSQKYEPMIAAGHSVIKRPEIKHEEFDDGLNVFDPEQMKKEQPVEDPGQQPESQPYSQPLVDTETMFKIENLTKMGIIDLLNDRGVECDENATKEVLHKQFIDSMKPVGVDPETEE